VPLALTGATELAAQFDSFTRQILGPATRAPEPSGDRKGLLGLERIASLW
jgi:hypothetical protein